jgi:hypothetical protein
MRKVSAVASLELWAAFDSNWNVILCRPVKFTIEQDLVGFCMFLLLSTLLTVIFLQVLKERYKIGLVDGTFICSVEGKMEAHGGLQVEVPVDKTKSNLIQTSNFS